MRGFTVRVEEEKAKILKAISSLEGKSVAQVLTELIDQYIGLRSDFLKSFLNNVKNVGLLDVKSMKCK
jgi:predicted DNA-binding protein